MSHGTLQYTRTTKKAIILAKRNKHWMRTRQNKLLLLQDFFGCAGGGGELRFLIHAWRGAARGA